MYIKGAYVNKVDYPEIKNSDEAFALIKNKLTQSFEKGEVIREVPILETSIQKLSRNLRNSDVCDNHLYCERATYWKFALVIIEN